ncbi:hypothetical protein [Trujillonella endophytica]|uniref:Chain length determinant protein n=1 Tax=Trujillonella endophytica TaxID=673521 RepID=A0A1H8W190_9ACTN|nr:hypothetical protein [Trujillella endophytica]SEP21370.1 hypothetical protein SAMN05660991_03959 [Trujillella endophytica]
MALPARPEPPHAPPSLVVARPASRTRRAAAVVALATLLGAAAIVAGTTISGPSYSSESQLLWDPSATQFLGLTPSDDPNSLERAVTDQRDVVTSDQIVDAAGDTLGLEGDVVRDAITVDVETGSSRLTITATADDAETAFRIADAVTTAYVQYVQRAGAEALVAQAAVLQPSIERLQGRWDELRQSLDGLTNQLGGLNINSAQYGAVQAQATQVGAELADAATRLADLRAQQESLTAGAEVYPGQAVPLRSPVEPTEPSSLSLPTAAALGAALGFLLGVCIVVLLHKRHTRLQPAGTSRSPA